MQQHSDNIYLFLFFWIGIISTKKTMAFFLKRKNNWTCLSADFVNCSWEFWVTSKTSLAKLIWLWAKASNQESCLNQCFLEFSRNAFKNIVNRASVVYNESVIKIQFQSHLDHIGPYEVVIICKKIWLGHR